MAAAIFSFRGMLSQWSIQNLVIFNTTIQNFSLVPNQQTYTLGPTGDWVGKRPSELDYLYLRWVTPGNSTPTDQPIALLNDAQWAMITAKTITSQIPTAAYFNPTYPDATISFWPVPTTGYDVVLYSKDPLDTFTSQFDELQFPNGYTQALAYNLAINLAPEYGRSVKPEVMKVAQESLAFLKVRNYNPSYLRTQLGSRRVGRGPSVILDMSRV